MLKICIKIKDTTGNFRVICSYSNLKHNLQQKFPTLTLPGHPELHSPLPLLPPLGSWILSFKQIRFLCNLCNLSKDISYFFRQSQIRKQWYKSICFCNSYPNSFKPILSLTISFITKQAKISQLGNKIPFKGKNPALLTFFYKTGN